MRNRDRILEELYRLIFQAEACLLAAPNGHRIHGYDMIKNQADLAYYLKKHGEEELAEQILENIKKCIVCMKVTATTGRTYFCVKTTLREMYDKVNTIPLKEYDKITFTD